MKTNKSLLTFLHIFFVVLKINAQCIDFDNLLQKGDKYLKNNVPNYQEAINSYTAAIISCPSRAQEAKQKISRMVSDINKLRENAVLSEKKAKETQKTIQYLLEESEKARIQLTNEKDKVVSLNEFIRYNNQQIFEAIKLNDSTMLELKRNEYKYYKDLKIDTVDYVFYYNTFFQLSLFNEQVGNLNYALLYANLLCKFFDNVPNSYSRRSIVHYYRSEWKSALADIDTALMHLPDSLELAVDYWNGSIILSNMGRYSESNTWADSTIKYRLKAPKREIWGDNHLVGDITNETGVYSLYLSPEYSIKAIESFKILNDLYAINGDVKSLTALDKQKIPISVLLTLINYTALHLSALPSDYIGYLFNGYLWELGGYQEMAEKNYKMFISTHSTKQRGEYSKYLKGFESQIYNRIK